MSIIQFDWRRHWKTKVEPHLGNYLVQACLDFGMRWLDRTWKRGDAPYLLGAMGDGPIVKGTLSWYQPLNRCHHISFFSMAIGVINCPELRWKRWKMLSGDVHTVPVGYDKDGAARVVMDILQFDSMTAEQSMAHATKSLGRKRNPQWETAFRYMEEQVVPQIRAEFA
jgi:hypothetical protein